MEHVLSNLAWIEELLPLGYDAVPKHGGMAYYVDMNLVMILVERKGLYEHKGISYPFELWNGCIFPVLKIRQNAFFLKYLFLENHPANKDWLYIPAEHEDFEDEVKQFMREIQKGNLLLGIPMKSESLTKSEEGGSRSKKNVGKKLKADKKTENALFLSIARKSYDPKKKS